MPQKVNQQPVQVTQTPSTSVSQWFSPVRPTLCQTKATLDQTCTAGRMGLQKWPLQLSTGSHPMWQSQETICAVQAMLMAGVLTLNQHPSLLKVGSLGQTFLICCFSDLSQTHFRWLRSIKIKIKGITGK